MFGNGTNVMEYFIIFIFIFFAYCLPWLTLAFLSSNGVSHLLMCEAVNFIWWFYWQLYH